MGLLYLYLYLLALYIYTFYRLAESSLKLQWDFSI